MNNLAKDVSYQSYWMTTWRYYRSSWKYFGCHHKQILDLKIENFDKAHFFHWSLAKNGNLYLQMTEGLDKAEKSSKNCFLKKFTVFLELFMDCKGLPHISFLLLISVLSSLEQT